MGKSPILGHKSSQVICQIDWSQVESSHWPTQKVLMSSRVKSSTRSTEFQVEPSQVYTVIKSNRVKSQVKSQVIALIFSKFRNLIVYLFIEKKIYISPWLHFNIVNICNVFLDILALCCRKIKPLWEKILSTGDDVAGTVKTFFANWFNVLNLIDWSVRINRLQSLSSLR
jgi:hypothetical protein